MALKRRKCPGCGKRFSFAADNEPRDLPFCSARCKLADLGNWFSGEYAVVEDLTRGLDLKAGRPDIDDPEVRAALDELNDG